MKKYNGFENEQEQEFITNVVKEAVDLYPKVHTYAVSLENGAIEIVLNDIKIELRDYDKYKAMHADWKDMAKRFIEAYIELVCLYESSKLRKEIGDIG